MMLGKRRQRPLMRRTTSMSEFYLDEEVLTDVEGSCESEHDQNDQSRHAPEPHPAWMRHMGPAAAGGTRNSSRGTLRRNSCDYAAEAATTASFLKSCGLCQRRLAPGRDIFMYRGEIAYCSMECRQQQMNQDELREKCALKSMSQAPGTGATAADQSSNGAETVAAA